MSNTFDKLSVLDSFIEEVNSYLPEIEANLDRLAQSPGDMDALEETYRRSHTIGGSASMMDFLGLAHVAHGMEDILGDALDGLTTLDEPTTGLLRRSLGRLRLLLEGIRSSGVKQEDVIAEDDADFAQYRAGVQASSPRIGVDSYEEYGQAQGQEISVPSSPQPFSFSMPSPSPAPSFDEVLASFHSPTYGEDVVWPEEPAPLDQRFSDLIPHSPLPAAPSFPFEPTRASSSALEELMASTRQASAPAYAPTPQPAAYEYEQVYETTYNQPTSTYEQPFEDLVAAYGGTMDSTQSPPSLPISQDILDHDVQTVDMIDQQGMALVNSKTSLPQVYTELQQGSQMMGVQVSSLQNQIDQLRSAMSIIEMQRGEFKGFLDGSKDALDRMEDWAGKAMGLNLRNSPEQVRRYLPLSVMWVSNNKLKKVLDLLHQITSGVEMTEDQMVATLQQLQSTIEICGETLQQMQSETAPVLKQDTGWTAWEMQVSQDAEALHERVTFERHGDPLALRNEIEQKIRDDLAREYEAHTSPLAIRAELEQRIREEVRQEYEAQKRLQESVIGYEDNVSIQTLEARLRNEIEIQVRQEFLEQIIAVGGDGATLRQPAPRDTSASSVSNFADRAREATGLAGFAATPVAEPPQPVPSPAPASSVPMMLPPQLPLSAPLTSSMVVTSSSSASSYSAAFSEEAIEIFRLEAEEHLQTISVHVAALEKAPTNRDLIQGIRRATHTLKGAASMMGFRAIADLCHISEDLLDNIMEGGIAISPAVLSIILDTAEVLDILITGRGASPNDDAARVQALRVRYTALLGEPSSPVGSVDEDIEIEVDAGDDILEASAPVGSVVTGGQLADTHAQRGARGDLNVRVRLQRLDELVNLFGELLVNRSVLEERVQRLVRLVSDVSLSSNRLRDVGQKLESRFEAATLPSGRSVSVMPGEGNQGVSSFDRRNGRTEPAHLAEFDELELDRYTEFHQLARGLSEGISDMGTLSTEMEAIIRECESIFARENRLSTTFQDRLMKIRLVPLSTMAPRLYRAARAVALKQRKEFDFLLEGEATEVDRTVFEEIAGPLLHIMRNAVNHAIETPEARIQKGKSPAGQIKLSAAYEGNQVVITVRDDGVGLDPEHIRSSAIARGLIRPDQALSEGDIIDLIFRPGFSTAEVLSEESGRGVGLDVVRDSVARLRGAIEVESMPGQGTAFTMKFPTSLAIQNAMMVMIGGHQFAIPTAMVETIGRLDSFKRTTIGGQPAILVRNEPYPLQLLAQYLSLPVGQIDEKAPLLLVNAGGQRVALVVDDVKGRFDIVMKNLGPHLRHVHGIAGGTVLGNGRVVLILELSDLLAARAKRFTGRREGNPAAQGPVRQSVDLSTSRQSIRGNTSTGHERGKHVLIVDDSPSVRRVVSNMLKQHGWEVQMARDGVEALEMISNETPAAVLLDIEMPRMDGYELTATVRAQEQYRTLPLVVLTSRAASKHQQRALQLGANAYVVKPYQDEELLNILNELVYGAGVR